MKDALMRKILLNLYGLPPEIQQLDEYERCYSCHLFQDKNIPWDKSYDIRGQYVPQSMRKPEFVAPIGKQIVDTLSANVFGYDKYPDIVVKTAKDIYDGVDVIEKAIEFGYLDQEDVDGLSDKQLRSLRMKMVNEFTQRFAQAILTQTALNPAMLDGTRKALIMGQSIVVYKFVNMILCTEVINMKYVRNLVFHKQIPGKLESFTEIYRYQDKDPENPTKTTSFWYRRDFDSVKEVEFFPIKDGGSEAHAMRQTWKANPDRTFKHDLGWCPAVLLQTNDGQSVFYGQVDNIKSYAYLINNLLNGLRANMHPQWAALMKSDDDLNSNQAPKHAGGIWMMHGVESLQCISPGAAGYAEARELSKELRKDILKGCRVEDASPSNYQSGIALTIKMAPSMDAIGEYRISFGECGLLPLARMILETCIVMHQRGVDLKLPEDILIPTEINCSIRLSWGPLQPVTEDTISKAIINAATAKSAKLVDKVHAAQKVATYFDVTNLADMLRNIEDESRDDALAEAMNINELNSGEQNDEEI